MIKKPVDLSVVQAMFPEANSRANVLRYYNLVHIALNQFGLTDSRLQLVAYATIRAESASFAPLMERKSIYNTLTIPVEYQGGGEFNLYEYRKKLGNDAFGDGAKYMGRGFVQITGKYNYTKYGAMVGLPGLANTPELANDPTVAAKLLAAYIADHRAAITAALDKKPPDFAEARRQVNGGRHGIEAFRKAYQGGSAALFQDERQLPPGQMLA